MAEGLVFFSQRHMSAVLTKRDELRIYDGPTSSHLLILAAVIVKGNDDEYGIPLKYESYEFVAPCTTLTRIPASLIKKFEITVLKKWWQFGSANRSEKYYTITRYR